jgi:GH15 family glucan-1,4-alpha-glucosidase
MTTPAPFSSPLVPPPLDHGVIGNGRVLALVSPTSAIEWLCLPRFDSPSVFGRILDAKRGGTFRILSRDREIRGALRYLPNTNVLSTRFDDGDCAWEVIDFAPRIPDGLTVRVPIEIVRILRPIRGEPRIRVDFDPRPDYARVTPELRPTTGGIEVVGGSVPMHLTTTIPVPYVLAKREIALTDTAVFIVSYGNERRGEAVVAHALHELDLTAAGWRAWAKTCALPNFGASAVLRSALCLKLHAYHDTGAIIAATTTSVPEAMGTQRTWDYRYCWLRDAAFTVEALRRLGHLSEGEQFLHFLRDVAESGPLQPLYAIDGERALTEEILPHLAGFGGSGPVRIGNAASVQRQNDLMGELVLCLETLLSDPRIDEEGARFAAMLERLVEEAVAAAPTRDTGIWEFRTTLKHYTFSRAMCAVAIQRGATLARRIGRIDLADRWEPIGVRERDEVLRRGYNAERGFFTQTLDGQDADASLLLLPTLGLIDARDPRFLSTIDAYDVQLVDRGLMLRYRNDDDFGQTTSAFAICSFWWAEALALAGRLEQAMRVFERVVAHANQVGLFSEDIEPNTGALLGNFPQAYTHVGLIHAAMTISELLEARDGRARAWT